VNERLRIKFGRISGGARTWENDLDLWALTEELQREYRWREQRNQHLRMGYSSLSNMAIRRRDNIDSTLLVHLDADELRRLQEFGLWSADFEPITSYFTVYHRSGAAYTDRSTEAMNLNDTFTMSIVGDYIYIGADEPFNDIDFYHSTLGVGITRAVSYYNGAWVGVAGLTDNTASFTASSNLTFNMPTDWVKTTNGGNLPSKYWVEIRITVAGTLPVWRYVRPTIPVMVLLQRSLDAGTTWNWYHDESYYPNLWVIEKVITHFMVGGRHDLMELSIVEGM